MLVAFACAVGVIINLNDLDRAPSDCRKLWKGTCWIGALSFAGIGMLILFALGQ